MFLQKIIIVSLLSLSVVGSALPENQKELSHEQTQALVREAIGIVQHLSPEERRMLIEFVKENNELFESCIAHDDVQVVLWVTIGIFAGFAFTLICSGIILSKLIECCKKKRNRVRAEVSEV